MLWSGHYKNGIDSVKLVRILQALVISASQGQKAVIDGKLMPSAYKAIYRSRFSRKEQIHPSGIKRPMNKIRDYADI